MRLTELFRHQSVCGKDVYVVDDGAFGIAFDPVITTAAGNMAISQSNLALSASSPTACQEAAIRAMLPMVDVLPGLDPVVHIVVKLHLLGLPLLVRKYGFLAEDIVMHIHCLEIVIAAVNQHQCAG